MAMAGKELLVWGGGGLVWLLRLIGRTQGGEVLELGREGRGVAIDHLVVLIAEASVVCCMRDEMRVGALVIC